MTVHLVASHEFAALPLADHFVDGRGLKSRPEIVEFGIGDVVAAFLELGELLAGQAHWSLL
jgi:hypothetical protein